MLVINFTENEYVKPSIISVIVAHGNNKIK